MNKSEQKAFNWLLKQGVDPNDITFRGNRTPDFILKDGREFEVKRLYKGPHSKKVMFSSRQLESLLEEAENTEILVFSDEKEEPVAVIPATSVRAGTRKWKGIKLYVWGEGTRKGQIHVTIDSKLAKWMDEKIKEMRFANRSHCLEVALMELKRKETVKL